MRINVSQNGWSSESRAERLAFELCRTERAASAETSLLALCRVAFEEDNKSVVTDEDHRSKRRKHRNLADAIAYFGPNERMEQRVESHACMNFPES